MRTATLMAICLVLPGSALAQDAGAGGAAVDYEAGGPTVIGRGIFEALNRHREANGVPPAQFSARAYIALQDHLDLLVKRGYRGGAPRNKSYPKLATRTRERHGWNLSLMDNYSHGRKGGMNPDAIIKVLEADPNIRSLLRKDLNMGAAAATAIPDTDEYAIVVGLTRSPKKAMKNLPKVAAAEKAWAEADARKRTSIVKGLGGLRDGEALLLLTSAVSDADAKVRVEAVKALARLGDCWPVPTLLDRMESEEDDDVKSQLQKAMEAISGKKDFDDVRKWRVWWSIERDIFVRRK